jgi:translation initiation factor 2B subunit (eIF-2B alpha/beta/delta family)
MEARGHTHTDGRLAAASMSNPRFTGWPPETRRVYDGLRSYEIVGASACAAAIVGALRALTDAAASDDLRPALRDAAAAFCELKPSTAAYTNVVDWLLHETGDVEPAELRRAVGTRAAAFEDYQRSCRAAIADAGCALLAADMTVLVHDYSSTVLAVLEEAGRRGIVLKTLVTAGEPVGKGAHVARLASRAGHSVTYASDSAVGRLVPEADLFLSGVETLFLNGDLANTVGTYPISLLAQEVGVPVYGVTECLKIHPTQQTARPHELTATLLKPWPPAGVELPPGTEVDLRVLDLTPAALITGLVTEQGVIAATDAPAALALMRTDLESRLS